MLFRSAIVAGMGLEGFPEKAVFKQVYIAPVNIHMKRSVPVLVRKIQPEAFVGSCTWRNYSQLFQVVGEVASAGWNTTKSHPVLHGINSSEIIARVALHGYGQMLVIKDADFADDASCV